MGKRMQLSEMRQCLADIIASDEHYLRMVAGNDNPQVVRLRHGAEARRAMAQDVLDALNGDGMAIRVQAKELKIMERVQDERQ